MSCKGTVVFTQVFGSRFKRAQFFIHHDADKFGIRMAQVIRDWVSDGLELKFDACIDFLMDSGKECGFDVELGVLWDDDIHEVNASTIPIDAPSIFVEYQWFINLESEIDVLVVGGGGAKNYVEYIVGNTMCK